MAVPMTRYSGSISSPRRSVRAQPNQGHATLLIVCQTTNSQATTATMKLFSSRAHTRARFLSSCSTCLCGCVAEHDEFGGHLGAHSDPRRRHGVSALSVLTTSLPVPAHHDLSPQVSRACVCVCVCGACSGVCVCVFVCVFVCCKT